MSQNKMSNVQYFVIIAEKKKKNKFLTLLGKNDAHAIDVAYAHGSIKPNTIAAAFGFESRQAKVVISCLLKTEKAKELIGILEKDYKFNKPNTGIAFSVSVEGLAY